MDGTRFCFGMTPSNAEQNAKHHRHIVCACESLIERCDTR